MDKTATSDEEAQTPSLSPFGRPRRDRTALLREIARIIGRRGYEATRFSDVAAETGTSISTLQYLFGTRDAMATEALVSYVEAAASITRTTAQQIEDPIARLRFVIEDLMGGTATIGPATIEERRDAWLVWIEYFRRALHDRQMLGVTRRLYAAWYQVLTDAIESALDAGYGRRPEDPSELEQMVRLIGSSMDGLGMQMLLTDTLDTTKFYAEGLQRRISVYFEMPELLDDSRVVRGLSPLDNDETVLPAPNSVTFEA